MHGGSLRLHRAAPANPEGEPASLPRNPPAQRGAAAIKGPRPKPREFLSSGFQAERHAAFLLGSVGDTWSGTISNAANTRAVSDRSPINLRSGSGNCFTNVGVTTI